MFDLATHPWMRGLFGDDHLAAIFAPEAEVKRMLKVEAAWTRALGDIGETPDAYSVADSIEAAQIDPQDLQDGFARDGVPVPALVKMLQAQLGPDAAEWVHKGLTSQDVMDTSLVLALQGVLRILLERLQNLDESLDDLQRRFGTARLVAFTRMQPALETRVAETIGRWRHPVPRLLTSVETARKQVAQIQWGGPIGMRDHPNAAQLGVAFARNLNLTDPGRSWHMDRSIIANVAHALVQITTAAGKIGEDIALMAAIGPSQITLSGGGSSAMAHKNNPVKAEALIALSDYAGTLQMSLTRAARHEGFRSGRAWTLEWIAMPQLCLATGASLVQTALLLESINGLGANA
ncbi:lyase family protein [Roseobacter weihaiensis]|uniref:lyase family protein n=1 Tax=Roseobacter weihaiensis TaxID=2763262 RepID=UPI001D0A0ABD|nr:lyase family protein [Roseobacter sp. H9]